MIISFSTVADWSIRNRLNVKVSRKLLRTVMVWYCLNPKVLALSSHGDHTVNTRVFCEKSICGRDENNTFEHIIKPIEGNFFLI